MIIDDAGLYASVLPAGPAAQTEKHISGSIPIRQKYAYMLFSIACKATVMFRNKPWSPTLVVQNTTNKGDAHVGTSQYPGSILREMGAPGAVLAPLLLRPPGG
eukprot:1848058-Rhodomonas_salina.1